MAIRVLVADDSLTVRRRLAEVLAADPEIEVVAEARDGGEAMRLCEALRPDVVTMDMMMPEVTGPEATEYIMAHCPTPILIVSASTNRGEVFKTYEALAAGALDVLEKPGVRDDGPVWERRLLTAVKLVARIRVVTHLRGRMVRRAQLPAADIAPDGSAREPYVVAAIGASTGGPNAALEILRALPLSFPIPLVLVLHISRPFADAFAEWLGRQTGFRVSFAAHMQTLASAAGTVVMAPPDRHLIVRDGRFVLNTDPERHSCRPSIDVLFESLARDLGPAAIACLLTGMGRDGAAGLLQVRRSGGVTIAQDEATSIVYGMPREAVRLGAASQVLPLPAIAPALAGIVSRGPERVRS